MYGVPMDLDLAFLHGAEVIQVCLGQYQVQLHFAPTASIFIQGGWELRDATATQISCPQYGPSPRFDPLHQLLGRRVVSTEVMPPKWFGLQFDGGENLRVFDDSKEFESFQIEPGGIIG
jgi:hypothetical protein